MEVHVICYLLVGAVMLFAGVYGFFTRRNLLATLISVELMLNAANINFAVFNRYLFPGRPLLRAFRHRHFGGRDGGGHCHYD